MVATAHSVISAEHFTTGTAGDICTFVSPVETLCITNRGSVNISFTIDGSVPTNLGDDCFFVPSGGAKVLRGDIGQCYLIAPSNCLVSVEGFAAGADAAVAGTSAAGAGDASAANQATEITSMQLLDDAVFTDDAAFTPGSSKGYAIGFEADETATDSVDEGDFGVPRMTLDRRAIVTLSPHTQGGSSFFKFLTVGTTALAVKASAGQIYGWWFCNVAATARFLKFYNVAQGSVTVGTTAPDFTLGIPAGAAANVAFPNGVAFSTAITIACTNVAADNDATAPTASDVSGVIFYK